GELAISLGGALDNHGQGALVSKGAQRIDAASLDNAQGIVSGESDVTLSIAGKLDNGRLDNSDGQLISQGRLDAILGGALVNTGAARLASGGDLRAWAAAPCATSRTA
ncbi:hypothetical protein KIP74_01070, partial [Pseudomonas aeruginosa]